MDNFTIRGHQEEDSNNLTISVLPRRPSVPRSRLEVPIGRTHLGVETQGQGRTRDQEARQAEEVDEEGVRESSQAGGAVHRRHQLVRLSVK